jgi:D-sedoheptulose 7-phosphate isomerase
MTNQKIANILIKAFTNGNHLYLCGNGGSNDLANHMEEEFICKFKVNRKPLPALALKLHSSTSNDFGYQDNFSRQIQAYGKPGDVLIGISTSGNSENVNNALAKANELGMIVIDFPRDGADTPEIQETQLCVMHDIARIVEKSFI